MHENKASLKHWMLLALMCARCVHMKSLHCCTSHSATAGGGSCSMELNKEQEKYSFHSLIERPELNMRRIPTCTQSLHVCLNVSIINILFSYPTYSKVIYIGF